MMNMASGLCNYNMSHDARPFVQIGSWISHTDGYLLQNFAERIATIAINPVSHQDPDKSCKEARAAEYTGVNIAGRKRFPIYLSLPVSALKYSGGDDQTALSPYSR